MPSISRNKRVVNVLVTGFGPFSKYTVNPSWLAVKPLHGAVFETDSALHPVDEEAVDMHGNTAPPLPPLIHCTVQKVPVSYESVLDRVPKFHASPPVIFEEEELPWISPPEEGYDIFVHVGVAGRGPLRMERLGHKLGYRMKDANGQLAPVYVPPSKKSENDANGNGHDAHSGLDTPPVGINRGLPSPSDAEMRERELYPSAVVDAPIGIEKPPIRGFGDGYTKFPDEIQTDIDVERLCKYVKDANPQVYGKTYTSMDAGHYLCDFIYYCSMAESLRAMEPPESDTTKSPLKIPGPFGANMHGQANNRVFFLHCPPENLPYSTAEVTEAIRHIVVWLGSQRLTEHRW